MSYNFRKFENLYKTPEHKGNQSKETRRPDQILVPSLENWL